MALVYKDAIIHGGACLCCQAYPLVEDAARIKQDPTGTGSIRRAMRAELGIHWRGMRVLLRRMLVEQDLLGLGASSLSTPMHMAAAYGGGGDKVLTFQIWLDNILKQQVFQGSGDYLRKYIERGYAKGVRFGENQLGMAMSQMQFWPMKQTADTVTQLAIIELQGVIEAVSQQAVRAVTNGILARQKPQFILRNVLKVIEHVGITRSNTIVEFTVVKAFGEGTLDVYQSQGVEHVGLVPEVRAPRKSLGDAARRVTSRKQIGEGPGSRSKGQVPSTRTVQRIRSVQRELERLERVNVQTAEDEDVCPVCEEIAENGPYRINTARALIPAHPHCRCAFIPAKRK